jgi:hypothetical protein
MPTACVTLNTRGRARASVPRGHDCPSGCSLPRVRRVDMSDPMPPREEEEHDRGQQQRRNCAIAAINPQASGSAPPTGIWNEQLCPSDSERKPTGL